MDRLEGFINGSSRNKLIVTKTQLDFINWIDVGKLLSSKISSFIDDRRLSMRVFSILEEIFESNVENSNDFGEYLAIYNLGILFESELNIDILALLDKHSRNKALFIYWNGEIKNNYLYFLSEKKGKEINIKNLSHIII